MGQLTIAMALFLAAGLLAGATLAATCSGALVLAGVGLIATATAVLALAYAACEPLAAAARRLASRRRAGSALLCAVCFGLLPTLVLVAIQVVAVCLLARADPAGGLLMLGWRYAVATAPATLLAALAGAERRTLWSIRAYAGHLSCWFLLAIGTMFPHAPGSAALLALAPGVLPATIGTLLALADARALRTARF